MTTPNVSVMSKGLVAFRVKILYSFYRVTGHFVGGCGKDLCGRWSGDECGAHARMHSTMCREVRFQEPFSG
eukprot:COSAG02_NODE_520_length_20751_cov_17.817112_3_plen_71_part_00